MISRNYESLVETIGNTPLVNIKDIWSDRDKIDVWGKIEAYNPGGSVKDRIALGMIESAEKTGMLEPGDTIVEPTSGNTGIGIALVAAVKGYEVILTMPESMSDERRTLLKMLGAKLKLTPADEGMRGAVDSAKLLAEKDGYFMPDQFSNPANPEIHRQTTAREIIRDTGGNIDYFVCGVGTGGTLTGVASVLKNRLNSVKIVAVEPAESPVISGGEAGSHGIQGIGAGFIPEVLDSSLIDDVITVSEEESLNFARRLAREEGLLVGISSGAAAAGVHKIVTSLPSKGSSYDVVTVFPDTAERYLSIFS